MRLRSHEFNGKTYFQCESDSLDLFRWRQLVIETDQMVRSLDEAIKEAQALIRERKIAIHRSMQITRKRRMLRTGKMKFVHIVEG